MTPVVTLRAVFGGARGGSGAGTGKGTGGHTPSTPTSSPNQRPGPAATLLLPLQRALVAGAAQFRRVAALTVRGTGSGGRAVERRVRWVGGGHRRGWGGARKVTGRPWHITSLAGSWVDTYTSSYGTGRSAAPAPPRATPPPYAESGQRARGHACPQERKSKPLCHTNKLERTNYGLVYTVDKSL